MPEEVSTPEELSVSLQQEPLKWVTYLNDITNYVTFLQSHIQEQEKTLQVRESYAETVTTEQNSVLREALDTNISLNGQVKNLSRARLRHPYVCDADRASSFQFFRETRAFRQGSKGTARPKIRINGSALPAEQLYRPYRGHQDPCPKAPRSQTLG